ncbi:sigma-70 family RNA polymerase sigma factor [Nonomuraea sp. NPDC048892]|uniref:RNA polymerase sigma factor n=1 Tax=Nonomuraea sp. NPDC048892 TaxID=3154624 RepID=UPI0033D7BC3B
MAETSDDATSDDVAPVLLATPPRNTGGPRRSDELDLPQTWGASDSPGAHMSCLLDDFSEFFKETYPALLAIMRLRTQDDNLAADISQETMVLALRHWQKVCGAEQPTAYVIRIAINVWRRLQTSKLTRERATDLTREDEAPGAQLAQEPPDEQVIGAAMVRWALDRLPPRQAEVAIRHYILDHDVKSIATELRISPSTVRSHLQKARGSLRELLQPLRPAGGGKHRA